MAHSRSHYPQYPQYTQSHRSSSVSSHSSSLADAYYDDDDDDSDSDDPYHFEDDDIDVHTPTAIGHTHTPSTSSQQDQQQQQHQPATPLASQQQTARKKASLAAINVPSFSAFRSNLPSAVKQPPHAAFHGQPSPRAVSFSLAEKASPRLAEPTSRPLSLDSPVPTQSQHFQPQQPSGLALPSLSREHEDLHERSSYTIPPTAHERNDSIDSRIASTVPSSAYSSSPQRPSSFVHAKHAHQPSASHAPQLSASSIDPGERSPNSRSSMIALQKAPTIHMDTMAPVERVGTDESLGEPNGGAPQRPKSPAGGLSSFFGWKAPQKSEGDTSPTTTFSDRSLSPAPSPRHVKTLPVDDVTGRRASARLTPPTLDIQKANGAVGYFQDPQTPLLLGANNAHVVELERELSHISQELAGSIRREMELEDELDRMRAELPMIPPSDINRRTSDYFSDSGASSTKFPITDVDAKLEQMERQLRKVEQEKANLKVEAASRLQTELSRRRDLEELVQNLEDQLDRGKAEGNKGKVEELESTLDETRRRLGQEKMTKESVEDLYSATREELEKLRNEADELRNEVVPQLKARVEGLETEAADNQALMYENTRLQQELATMRDSNHSRFNSIAEEGVASAINPARMSLTRSGSLARSSSLRRGGSVNQKDGGRQRSGSTSVAYPDGFKEIEDQRDALHKALKLLIKRHEKQQKEHERAVKKLTTARDRAEQITPKRTAYSKEVFFLKEEVTTLRKRTEDALEQKWQYEKNLSGLKMDLDRAEQETRGLRIMLQDKDMDLQTERSFSISGASGTGEDEDDELKVSISRAENERDHARQVAEDYRRRATAAGGSSELMNSAQRMEELAGQLEQQVQANAQLRDRLSSAIAKGEREQKDSTRQIEEMQRRLAGMEDSVMAAQQHSETTLANHDAEVRRIEDASSPQLQRLAVAIPEPSKLSPSSPLLKMSPKLGSKKLSETSLLEMSRTHMLERKVRELEGLLREAEEDVQIVVQRVNKSQMEVADLQTERDAALVQMRKLQNLIVEEREKAEALMPK